MLRIGLGNDIHKLVEGRPLVLGGITVPSEKGCMAHSDGDVLVHGIIDSLLGALSLGDIGDHFPDTESKYKDISSLVLLEEVMSRVRKEGYEVVNLDTVIVLQSPKLGPYKEKIREQIAKTMALDVSQVSIKAKTAEHMLMELGESNAILSGSVVLLEKTKA